MKKLILLFFIIFFFFYSKARDVKEVEASDSSNKWYWGFDVRVCKNYRTISGTSNLISRENSTQKLNGSCNAGVIAKHNLNNNFQFETGVFVANKGYQSNEYTITQYNYSPHSGYSTYYYLIRDDFSFWYVDIPIKIHYQRGKKALFLTAGVGMVINLFLSEKNDSTFIDNNNGPDYSSGVTVQHVIPSKSGISYVGEVSLNYLIKNTQLSLGPFYERSLTSVSVGPALYLYSYGIGIKLIHKL
jgi:hypothetical protein